RDTLLDERITASISEVISATIDENDLSLH
ncbi:unnamed protein product, partial [Rotaria socialis]